MAEKMVMESNGRNDLATVCLRPHLIWGPGDPHLLPRIVERAKNRKLIRVGDGTNLVDMIYICLLYTSPSPRDRQKSRMPSSA